MILFLLRDLKSFRNQEKLLFAFFDVLLMEDLSDFLVLRREKTIDDRNLRDLLEPMVSGDKRVEVKVKREINRLADVDHLLVEAEALDLIEVVTRLLGVNAIGGDPDNRLISVIGGPIEGEGCFPGVDSNGRLDGGEGPVHRGVHVGLELHVEFSHFVDFSQLRIVLLLRVSVKSDVFAVELVERDGEVAKARHEKQSGDVDDPEIFLSSLGRVVCVAVPSWLFVTEQALRS